MQKKRIDFNKDKATVKGQDKEGQDQEDQGSSRIWRKESSPFC